MPTPQGRYHLVFMADGVDQGLLRPVRLVAVEEVSQPHVVDVDLRGVGAELDPQGLLWKGAQVLVVRAEDGSLVRRFTGVITRAREDLRPAGLRDAVEQVLRVRIESPLALLRWSSDYRVRRNVKVDDVVKEVLDRAGIPAEAVRFQLSETYVVRETCTQLGESMLDFVSRLLEEEGIFHFCTHEESGPVLCFADAQTAYAELDPAQVPYRPPSGLIAEEAILELSLERALAPSKVTLGDRDYLKPDLDLRATATRDASVDAEHYDHPAGHRTPAEGKRRAAARLAGMQASAEGARGSSSAFALCAGHTFEVTDCGDDAYDRKWVVARVEHRWDDTLDGASSYENRFRLADAESALRPLPRAPRPRATPQVAIVVGPQGEDVHVEDAQGRVRIKYPWDRRSGDGDDDSVYAIARVAQAPLSNAVAIPRIGWEVLVDFEDGDPDRPIVLGRLFNPKYPPPYTLPKHQTVTAIGSYSSPGREGENLIRIDDGAGAEMLRVHAQKDLAIETTENRVETVGKSESIGVVGAQSVEVGGDQKLEIKADHELRIGGDQSWTVKANRNETVKGEQTVDVGKDRKLTVSASHERQTDESDTLSIGGAFAETIGAALTQKAAKEVIVLVGKDAKTTVGAAMSETVEKGRSDLALGKRSLTVGGASMATSGKDYSIAIGGDRKVTIGAAWVANAGAKVELSSDDELKVTVAGALAFTGASQVVFKVGGSTLTLAGGAVVLSSKKVKLTANGPNAQLAAIVADK